MFVFCLFVCLFVCLCVRSLVRVFVECRCCWCCLFFVVFGLTAVVVAVGNVVLGGAVVADVVDR